MAGGPNGGWGLKLMHENYAILDRRFDESAIASGAALPARRLSLHQRHPHR